MVERKRHLAKAITYRAFGSATTAAIAYVATGHAGIGVSVGIADSLIKIGGYYIHERIWYRIKWGIRAAPEEAAHREADQTQQGDAAPVVRNPRPMAAK
jgi:uncharacterized membrane protein